MVICLVSVVLWSWHDVVRDSRGRGEALGVTLVWTLTRKLDFLVGTARNLTTSSCRNHLMRYFNTTNN